MPLARGSGGAMAQGDAVGGAGDGQRMPNCLVRPTIVLHTASMVAD